MKTYIVLFLIAFIFYTQKIECKPDVKRDDIYLLSLSPQEIESVTQVLGKYYALKALKKKERKKLLNGMLVSLLTGLLMGGIIGANIHSKYINLKNSKNKGFEEKIKLNTFTINFNEESANLKYEEDNNQGNTYIPLNSDGIYPTAPPPYDAYIFV